MSLVTGIKGFTISTVKQLAISAMTGRLAGVPLEYQVNIQALGRGGTEPGMQMWGALQEPIQIKTGSRWEPFIDGMPFAGIVEAVNTGAQIWTGYSTTNIVTSRRIWRGSDPVEIKAKLAFYEESDAQKDVMDNVILLQQLALPTGGGREDYGFLRPPGPSPARELSKQGTDITIKLGTICQFKHVVITEVIVTLDTRLSGNSNTKGLSIAAIAEVTFQTYQMLTQEQLKAAYTMPVEGKGTKQAPKATGANT